MTELVSKSLNEYEDEIFFFDTAKSEAQLVFGTTQTTLNRVKQKAKCLVPLDNVVEKCSIDSLLPVNKRKIFLKIFRQNVT